MTIYSDKHPQIVLAAQQYGVYFKGGRTSRHLPKHLAKGLAELLQRKGFVCVIVQDPVETKPHRYWVHVAQ